MSETEQTGELTAAEMARIQKAHDKSIKAMAELEGLSRKNVEKLYASAIANWDLTMDDLDESRAALEACQAENARLRERLDDLESAGRGALPCINDDLVRNTLALSCEEARAALAKPKP